MPVCRSPIGYICRGRGRTTDRAAPRRMCRARSGSRPSRRSRWSRSARLLRLRWLPVRDGDPKPKRVSVEALARSLPKHAWRTISWREGSNARLQSRFARVRVRAAPIRGEARFAEETLLIEWPKDEAAPTKFWLATVDHDMPFRDLVDLAKLRWRIERDY